jgi:hypothetical protein
MSGSRLAGGGKGGKGEAEAGTAKGNATSRTLHKEREGLRHPLKFVRGLNESGCDLLTGGWDYAPPARQRHLISLEDGFC